MKRGDGYGIVAERRVYEEGGWGLRRRIGREGPLD